MANEKTPDERISALKAWRNTLFVCAVLAAGSAAGLTSRVADLQAQAGADAIEVAEVSATNETLRLHELILSSQLDETIKTCAEFESRVRRIPSIPTPSWLTSPRPTWTEVKSACRTND